jgi:hypothetical protein
MGGAVIAHGAWFTEWHHLLAPGGFLALAGLWAALATRWRGRH